MFEVSFPYDPADFPQEIAVLRNGMRTVKQPFAMHAETMTLLYMYKCLEEAGLENPMKRGQKEQTMPTPEPESVHTKTGNYR